MVCAVFDHRTSIETKKRTSTRVKVKERERESRRREKVTARQYVCVKFESMERCDESDNCEQLISIENDSIAFFSLSLSFSISFVSPNALLHPPFSFSIGMSFCVLYVLSIVFASFREAFQTE